VPIIKAEIHREDVFVHCVNHGSALWSVPDSADKRWSMKADRFTDSRTGALASTKRRHYRGPRSCQDQIVLHIHKHTHTPLISAMQLPQTVWSPLCLLVSVCFTQSLNTTHLCVTVAFSSLCCWFPFSDS